MIVRNGASAVGSWLVIVELSRLREASHSRFRCARAANRGRGLPVARTYPLFAHEALRRCLYRRRCRGQVLGGIARAWRIDPLAIDHALGVFGGGAGYRDPTVPALGAERAPGAEIENGAQYLISIGI